DRVAWSDQAAFRAVAFARLKAIVRDFDAPDELRRMVHPKDPYALVDAIRAIAKYEKVDGSNPFVGGPVGPKEWRPSVGKAIAEMLEVAFIDSLHRLAPRWAAVAADGGGKVNAIQLMPSAEADRVIAEGLVASGVLRLLPETHPGKSKTDDKTK